MKATGILCVAFAFSQVQGRALNEDNPNIKLSPLQEACLNELKLTDQKEAIANINNRSVCPEDNSNYNKFISCFWKKTGRQNENGEINYETLRQFVRAGILQALGDDAAAVAFAEENSTKIVNKCRDISGENPEKVVVMVRNCIAKGLDAVGGN